jgi:hypothetical protein
MAVLPDWGNTAGRVGLMPCIDASGRPAAAGQSEADSREGWTRWAILAFCSLCSIIFGCRASEGVRVSKRVTLFVAQFCWIRACRPGWFPHGFAPFGHDSGVLCSQPTLRQRGYRNAGMLVAAVLHLSTGSPVALKWHVIRPAAGTACPGFVASATRQLPLPV